MSRIAKFTSAGRTLPRNRRQMQTQPSRVFKYLLSSNGALHAHRQNGLRDDTGLAAWMRVHRESREPPNFFQGDCHDPFHRHQE
jgi:hypothetical protein